MKTGLQAFDLGAGIGVGGGLAGLTNPWLPGAGIGNGLGCNCGGEKLNGPGPISITVPQSVYSQIGREKDSTVLNGLGGLRGPGPISIGVPQSVMRWNDDNGGYVSPTAGTLHGLRKRRKGLGDASSDLTNYDIITINGKQYSANQIVDKSLQAQGNVPLYLGSNFNTPFTTIKSGQIIGKVYSYIRASEPIGKIAGSQLLMFYTSDNKAYYVKDDAAINQSALKDQGTLTVTDENKLVQDEQDKASDPVGYYLKKYGLPVLLIGGAIYLVGTVGKAYIDKPKAA